MGTITFSGGFVDGSAYTNIKGKNTERRFEEIARTLKKCFPDIKVQKTTWKLDRRGVDFVITLNSLAGRRVTIPVQVKSSYYWAEQFWKKYPNYKHHNVILVIVNDHRTRHDIFEELRRVLERVLEAGICYKNFFQMLEHVPKGDPRRKEAVQRQSENKRKKDKWKAHTLPYGLDNG